MEKVVRMVVHNRVTASDGSDIEVRGESICFHGDNPRGPEIVAKVKAALQNQGVSIVRLDSQSAL